MTQHFYEPVNKNLLIALIVYYHEAADMCCSLARRQMSSRFELEKLLFL